MLTKEQEAEAVALVEMILSAMSESDIQTPERSYSVKAWHRTRARQAPKQFPIEVWRAVVRDFEKRGYSAWIDDRMIFTVAAP